jgi:GntR family transcriptional regulator/MocR family aminotransferase
LDHDANAIYLGTVSKTLSPLLRLGYLVVPSALIDAFAAAKRLADRHSPTAEQLALAELITSGAYERHVRKARRRNAQRRAAFLDALSKIFGSAITVEGSDAGLHVVVWFNHIAGEKEHMIAQRARRAGVGIHPISSLYADAGERGRRRTAGLVMGYAALDERGIRRGVALLREALGARADLS